MTQRQDSTVSEVGNTPTLHPDQDLLDRYLIQDLDPTVHEQVHQHLQSCTSCRTALHASARIGVALSSQDESSFQLSAWEKIQLRMDSTLHPVRPARLLAAPGVGIATALMLAAVRPSPPPEYQPLVVFPGADDRAAAEPSTVIPMGPARVVSRALTTDTRDFDATLWLEDKEGERHLTQQVTLRGQNILSTHDFSDSQLLPGPYTLFVEVCPVSILSALPYYVPCQTLQTDLTLQA